MPASRLLPVAARALALLLAGGGAGVGLSLARSGGLPRPSVHEAACEAPAVEPVVLSAADAAHACAAERALIADARSEAAFAAGHVAGAVHLACDTRGDVASAALANLADRSLVLVYGENTAGALEVARSIARRLPATGGPRIFALDGGFSAWEKAGLACASGPCEACGPLSSPAAPVSK